jgi:tRNA nucleotidyltransferase (CCA-adding enzyme)
MRKLGALAVLLPELDRCHGVEQNEYHPDDVYWHTLKSIDEAPRDNIVVRWAALLHDLGKVDKRQEIVDEDGATRVVFYGHEDLSTEMANNILRRLRYSSDIIRDATILVQNHMFHYSPEWSSSAVRRFIRRVGEGNLEDLFKLREADVLSRDLVDEVGKLDGLRQRIQKEIESDSALKKSDLAIDGHDVIEILGLSEGKAIGKILSELFDLVLDSPELNTREALTDILREKYRS